MSGWNGNGPVRLNRLDDLGMAGFRHKKTGFREPIFLFIGGERGIRTLDTFRYTHFPGVLLRPLGHLSVFSEATIEISPRRLRCSLWSR